MVIPQQQLVLTVRQDQDGTQVEPWLQMLAPHAACLLASVFQGKAFNRATLDRCR